MKARRGLRHLTEDLDYEFVTYRNPVLLQDLVDRIKIARYQGPPRTLSTFRRTQHVIPAKWPQSLLSRKRGADIHCILVKYGQVSWLVREVANGHVAS